MIAWCDNIMMYLHQSKEFIVRTTIDIENDVLAAAKEIARTENVSVGKVISRLVRQALAGHVAEVSSPDDASSVTGFRPFPSRGVIVSNELINRLRDEEGI